MKILEEVVINKSKFDVRDWTRVTLDFTQDGQVVLYRNSVCILKENINSNSIIRLTTRHGTFFYREKTYSKRENDREFLKERGIIL